MALDLADYEPKVREAIKLFWWNRDAARLKQLDSGKADQGERAGVTGGKNMDGFLSLVEALVRANGLVQAKVHRQRALLTLPGFFRPTKLWDMVIMRAFGDTPRHFAGWLMLVEDAPGSRVIVRDASPLFPVLPEFQGASYAERYDVLCRKLVQEQLYTAASVLVSPRSAVADGSYCELSDMTGLKTLVTTLAGHIAAEAARS